jgi:hypothetical protein
VLDGVCVVRAGLLEESLEVVCWRPHLALATMRGGRDARHVGVICFLVVIVIIVSHGRNPLRVPLTPLLATLGTLVWVGDRGLVHPDVVIIIEI